MGRMIKRLEYAAQLQKQGIKIGTLVLLSGDRPLGDVDKTEQFADLPSNETKGMKLIYDKLDSLEGSSQNSLCSC